VIERLDGLREGARLSTDVLIVGAGAAGIVMARDLARRGVSALVVEAGGRSAESYDRAMYESEIIGDPYSTTWTRYRALGGSTRVWAGWSRPLDAWDMSLRPWVGGLAWPFTMAELNPWYRRAARLLNLGPYEWNGDAIADSVGQKSLKDVAGARSRLRSPAWRFMPEPRDFAVAFRGFLRGPNARIILDATVVDCQVDRGRARSVTVQSSSGRKVTVDFQTLVLAAGGIENVRLLWEMDERLKSRGRTIDRSRWLGRGWQEHPHVPIGVGVFSDRVLDGPLWLHAGRRDIRGVEVLAGLGFPRSVLERNRMANFSATITDWYFGDDTPYLAGMRATVAAATGRNSHARVVYARTESRVVQSSRITMSGQKDAMGRNLPRLDWKLAQGDYQDLQRGARLLAHAFADLRLGVMHESAAEDRMRALMRGGAHHIGGARMSLKPVDGVTDGFGAVHQIPNVFVTGSATFPSGGFANPTLTIAALVLRQAKYLADER